MVIARSTDFYLKKFEKKRITRALAIKLYCRYACCNNDIKSWVNCSNCKCFLWHFRKGKETLGNQTSFKKHRENSVIQPQNSIIQPILIDQPLR